MEGAAAQGPAHALEADEGDEADVRQEAEYNYDAPIYCRRSSTSSTVFTETAPDGGAPSFPVASSPRWRDSSSDDSPVAASHPPPSPVDGQLLLLTAKHAPT